MDDGKPDTGRRRSWPRRMLNRLEVDRATFYALLVRAWQLPAGMVSMLLIVAFFSPEVQGYYYTFASLLALQAIAELGQQFVIVSVAGHEWARLRLENSGEIAGDQDAHGRLAALTRGLTRWGVTAAALFVVVVGAVGVVFFSQAPNVGVTWLAPWITLVCLTGASLWTMPLVALLEGCGQTRQVYKTRVAQAIAANAVVWLCIPLGANLWTPVAAAAVKALFELALVLVAYRGFFVQLWRRVAEKVIDWRGEVWPLQWRAGVQSLFAYGALQLFAPVMFQFHGPDVAGRMGLTWTVLTVLQTAALGWIETRIWLLSQLIAKRDYRELDRVFFRLFWISLAVLAFAAAGFVAAVAALNMSGHPLAVKISSRLLPLGPTLLLAAAVVLFHISRCQTVYIRAHKRDPVFGFACAANAAIALSVWGLGSAYGPLGAAWGYLTVRALFNFPVWTWLWMRCRRGHQADAD